MKRTYCVTLVRKSTGSKISFNYSAGGLGEVVQMRDELYPGWNFAAIKLDLEIRKVT